MYVAGNNRQNYKKNKQKNPEKDKNVQKFAQGLNQICLLTLKKKSISCLQISATIHKYLLCALLCSASQSSVYSHSRHVTPFHI